MTFNIKQITSFKHLTRDPLGNAPAMALNNCGINTISSIYGGASTVRVGEMTVLGNTFCGLMATTAAGKSTSTIDIPLPTDETALKAHALQIGIRITQTAVPAPQRGKEVLGIVNYSAINTQPLACTLTEDNSAYYEIVLSLDNSHNIQLQVFVNKQLTVSRTVYFYEDYPITLKILRSAFVVPAATRYAVMIDDIYIAELDYNTDGTVTPRPLGELSLAPFTVATYHGDEHTNTKGSDIVTALNNFNPFDDMGVLAIKAGGAPASLTFNVPDFADKRILGAALSVVYKDTVAPNNRLHYQITQGTIRHPAKTITERSADVADYTQFTQFITTPAVIDVTGGMWNASSLTFTLDLANQVDEE